MKRNFSKIGFILSIVGAAIGLGNAWKFPYMVGANGGSAFVLIYLFFAVSVGLCIFYAESAMGKISRRDPARAFAALAPKNAKIWGFAGVIMITGILIASFYTLIIGWVVKYAVLSLGELPRNLAASAEIFARFTSQNLEGQILYFTLAFLACFAVLAKGVKSGIERINLWLIPTLFVLLLLMLGYSFSMSGFNEAAKFLLVPDFSKINTQSVINALGLAFFTMCVGIGAILTYSASLDDKTNLFTSSLYVVALNVIISVVIGLIVFTFTFEFGARPSQGAGLAFISLPTLFANLGALGNALSFTFFTALVFAGITSAVSLIEPCVFYLERTPGFSRAKALFIVGGATYVLGALCAAGNDENFKDFLAFFGKDFFSLMDYASSNVMLPLGGIIIAVFAGYFMKKEALKELFVPFMGEGIFKIWYFSLRYFAPFCVFFVMINAIFFQKG